MTDMQEMRNSSVFKKKIVIYGAVFFCVIFVVWTAIGGATQIKSFGAKFISIAEKSFGVQEKELGVVLLHEKTNIEEEEIITSTSPTCTFETLETAQKKLVVINEIAWMGGISGADAEWIELKNISGSYINLRGWEIVDKDEQIKIKVGDTTLSQNGFFLAVRKSNRQKLKGETTYDGALRNTDEGVRLFNAECGLEDEVIATKWPAGDNKTKKTMERNSNGSGWYTSLLSGGTPGSENSKPRILNSKQDQSSPPKADPPLAENLKNKISIIPTNNVATTTMINKSTSTPISPTSSITKMETVSYIKNAVLISEVSVGTEENAKYEFVELYNNSSFAVDLTGWTIKKKSSTGNETSLVSTSRLQGKIILPQSYFLIGNEGGYKGSPTPNAMWAGSYTLAYSKNSVALYKGGEKVDEANWEEIPKGRSIKRISWGSNNFSLSDPSPGRE